MSPTVRSKVLDTIGRQQAALDLAIERGNVGMECINARRTGELERVLDDEGDGHELAG